MEDGRPRPFRNMWETKKPRPEGEAVWRGRPRPRGDGNALLRGDRLDHHELAQLTAVLELNPARDLGKQRVILAAANVQAWLNPSASLPHDNRAAGNELSAKSLEA